MDILILEENRRYLRAARFRAKGGTLSFLGADRFTPTEEENIDLLGKKLSVADEIKEKIVLSLDPAAFFCREMELPINDRRKVREILPLELKGETALDADESAFDAIHLGGNWFLAVWGRRKDISARIESVTRAGLEPQIVTCAPFHWQSLLPQAAEGCVALSDGTALAIYQNRELVHFRAWGDGDMLREMEKTLTALELSKGIRVEQVFLFGEAFGENADSLSPATIGGIPSRLLPVNGSLAEAFVNNRDAAVSLAGTWALAKEVVSGMPLNFRSGELAYTAGFERAKKKLLFTGILATLLIMLLLAETGIRYCLVKKDLNSLNTSIRTMYREIFPTRKKAVDEVAELKSEIRRMGGDQGSQSLLVTMKK
ncbi:MAG TPA: type II secretion system protein GspL, partial [Geobacteraceae bacterium]|nr:type II secretion system protein GspL [Geobacteraceae bacterium]